MANLYFCYANFRRNTEADSILITDCSTNITY